MQVFYGLARIRTLIDHEPVTVCEPLLLGDLSRRVEDVLVISGFRHSSQTGDFSPRDDQHVHGRLRIDVTKRKHVLILINDLRRYFPIENLRE